MKSQTTTTTRRSRSSEYDENDDQRPEVFAHQLFKDSSTPLLLPKFGLGTFRLKGAKCTLAVKSALKLGVRLIDTAESYKNAQDIAKAIADFRKEIINKNNNDDDDENAEDVKITIITKVSKESMSAAGVSNCISQQLKLLYGINDGKDQKKTNENDDDDDDDDDDDGNQQQKEKDQKQQKQKQQQQTFLDVVLLHWPGTTTSNPKSPKHAAARLEAWRALVEEQQVKKRVKIIGVSNFTVAHLRHLSLNNLPLPQINQVEVHPYHQQRELREFCKANGILVQAFTSLGRSTEPPRCLYGNFEPDHPRLVKDPLILKIVKAINDDDDNEAVFCGSQSKQDVVTPQILLLRWAIENDLFIIPKASCEEHIRENLKAVDDPAFWARHRTITEHKLDWVKMVNDEIVVPACGDGVERNFIGYAYVPEKIPV